MWVDGGVCSETPQNQLTLNSLNTLFNLSNLWNFWSVGNHDDIPNGNEQWKYDKTEICSFYTSYLNRLTVCDISDNWNRNGINCNSIQAQFEMLSHVCDTIE